MELVEIFSVPVFREKLNLNNEEIKSYCLLQEKINSGKILSNCGGWQSYDFVDPPFQLKDLFEYILYFSTEISDFLEINHVKFSNAWININRYKDFNWPHTHPGCVLSGVYYVKTPENCGDIQFEHSPIENILGDENIKNFNKFNSHSWWMPSKEGTLYIFPSWIKHRVKPNMNKDEERISISFNLK